MTTITPKKPSNKGQTTMQGSLSIVLEASDVIFSLNLK